MRAENWQWLGRYSDQLNLSNCALEIARTAFSKGAKVLAAQIAENQLATEEIDALAREIYASGDFEALELMSGCCGEGFLREMLCDLAEKQGLGARGPVRQARERRSGWNSSWKGPMVRAISRPWICWISTFDSSGIVEPDARAASGSRTCQTPPFYAIII